MFDVELSRRIDVYVSAIDRVQAWPDSRVKQTCMIVLRYRLLILQRAAGI
jgi:hypothetical protein